MVTPLLQAGVDARNIDVFTPGGWGNYGTVYLSPFFLRHNVPNCGWRIHGPDGSKTIYATDTSSLDGVKAQGYGLFLIEANHREADLAARKEAKLAAGEFSYEAAAAENHLSYEKAVEWLSENMGPASKWVPMHGHREKGREA